MLVVKYILFTCTQYAVNNAISNECYSCLFSASFGKLRKVLASIASLGQITKKLRIALQTLLLRNTVVVNSAH